MGVFVGYGCSNDSSDLPDDEETPFSLMLSETSVSALIGDTRMLRVTNASKDAEIEWSTSNANVVTVDDGRIEALREGTAKIKADYKGYTAECTVNVGFGANMPKLVVKNANSSLKIGKTQTAFPLEAVVVFNGREFTDVELAYESDGEVLDVNYSNGEISPREVVGKQEVFLTATWRGYSVSRFPTLFTKVEIEVVDELFFWVNGEPMSNINLYTLASHNGVDYVNSMDFNITGELNGIAINPDEVEIVSPAFLNYDESSNVITSLKQGNGTIYFNYNDFVGAVNVNVEKVTDTFGEVLDYFSLNLGTYKDHNDEWRNKSVVDTVFAGYDEEIYSLDTLQAYIGSKKIKLTDGKIFGLPVVNGTEYNQTITLETDKFSIDVDLVVYGLVIKEAQDLKNLELKILKRDDPETTQVDETEVTCVEGYCVLLNSIDATGIKIEHEIFEKYTYVNAKGETVETSINPSRYRHKNADRVPFDNSLTKFGFVGDFNGLGNTIFNLDVSVDASDTTGGGGLFGYTLGGAKIYDVGFKNLNCSNACGLVIDCATFAPLGGSLDPLGLREEYSTIRDVYIHLAPETVNPKGALAKAQIVAFGRRVYNVIVDASEISASTAETGGALVATVSTYPQRQYYTAYNIFVISPEVPAAFNAEYQLVGKNIAGDNFFHDQKIDGKHYAHDIYTYESFDAFIADKHDYDNFSSSWLKLEYPVFRSSQEIVAEFNGVVRYDNRLIVSNLTQEKHIKLKSLIGTTISNATVDYDTSKLTIAKVADDDFTVKLAQDPADTEIINVTFTYLSSSGRTGTLVLEVTLSPSTIVITEEYLISAKDLERDIANLLVDVQELKKVTQTIDGGEPSVFEINEEGEFKSVLNVEVLDDNSNVKTSELIIETTDLVYKLTNAKVYTHVIKEGSDLLSLAVKNSDVTGYFVLANNISAYGVSMPHTTDSSVDTQFQGILDGRGYAIYNLKVSADGLLKEVRSDNSGVAIIKNLGFVNLSAADDKEAFAVLGKRITAADGKVTEISNVHVHVEKTTDHKWPGINNFKGMFNAIPGSVYDVFEMTNVYIDVDNEWTQQGVNMTGFGTITAHDQAAFGTSQEVRQASKRFNNVVTIAKSNPSVYRNTYEYEQTLKDDKCYFIYAENTIGKSGGVSIGYVYGSAQEIRPIAHPNVSDDIANGSYIYYGVYKYENESAFATEGASKISIFTDTGYWEMRSGKLTWKTMLDVPEDTDSNFDPGWIPGVN